MYKRQYTDKTLTLRKSMYMRANGASELRKFSHFYILKLLIFCCYTSEVYQQNIKSKDKRFVEKLVALLFRKVFFIWNNLLFSDTLSVQMTCLSAYM